MKYLSEETINKIFSDLKKNKVSDSIIANMLWCNRATVTTAKNTWHYTKYIKLSMTTVFANRNINDIVRALEYDKIVELSKIYCKKYEDGIDDILYDLKDKIK